MLSNYTYQKDKRNYTVTDGITAQGATAATLIHSVTNVITSSGPRPTSFKINEANFRVLDRQYRGQVTIRKETFNGKYINFMGLSYGHATVNPPDILANANILDPQWQGLIGRSIEKVLAQARGSHANLSVDFAEGGQTIAMLRNALRLKKFVIEFATQVVKARGYRKIRSGPTQGQRRLDYVNGKWLEYRYGWMPLVSSIYDMADALRKQRVSSLVVLKGRSGRQEQRTVYFGAGTRGSPFNYATISGSYRVETAGYFSIPTNASVSDFTSLNPLLIAWELVPFSFVADWFVGVGQCLENWENYFLYRNNFITGYQTTSSREIRTGQIYGASSSPLDIAPNGALRDKIYYESINSLAQIKYSARYRGPLSSLPTPGGPRVKLGLKPKQMLDVAALIGQAVKRFR